MVPELCVLTVLRLLGFELLCVTVGLCCSELDGPKPPSRGAKSIVERRFHDTPGCQTSFDNVFSCYKDLSAFWEASLPGSEMQFFI